MIPADALAALETRATIDVDRIAEIERTTDHDIIAFVSQVAETVGPEGRYLHLGLTSSDVVDTGLALQLRAAGARLLADCDRLVAALVARARAEADTTMMGRTHSVHAEPITFGLKVAGWAFEIDRGRARLATRGRRGRDRQDLGTGGDVQPPRPGHRGRRARRARACTPIPPAARSSSATGTRRCSRRSPSWAAAWSASPRRSATSSTPRSARSRSRSGSARRGRARCPTSATRSCPSGSPAWPGCCAATPRRRSRTSRCGTSATSAIPARSG